MIRPQPRWAFCLRAANQCVRSAERPRAIIALADGHVIRRPSVLRRLTPNPLRMCAAAEEGLHARDATHRLHDVGWRVQVLRRERLFSRHFTRRARPGWRPNQRNVALPSPSLELDDDDGPVVAPPAPPSHPAAVCRACPLPLPVPPA